MATKQETEFYVRTKTPDMSFVDHETGISVHGNGVTLVTEPVGKKTRQFLRAGGLIKATDEEVAKAEKKGRVVEGDVFTNKTKIVMVPSPAGSLAAQAGMMSPKEVPLEEGDVLEEADNSRANDDPNLGVHGVIDSELGLDDVLRAAKTGKTPEAKAAEEDPAKGAKSVPRGEGNVKSEGGVGANKDTGKDKKVA